LADLQLTVYPHSGYLLAEGQAQDRVSSPAKDRRSANCATQPTDQAKYACICCHTTRCIADYITARIM